MKNKKFVYSIIGISAAYVLLLFIIYYFGLPFINFGHVGFYFYLAAILAYIFALVLVLTCKKFALKNIDKRYKRLSYNKLTGKFYLQEVDSNSHFNPLNQSIRAFILVFGFVGVLLLVFALVGSKMFNSKAYYEQLEIKEAPEQELLEVFDYDNGEVLLPIIDKDLAYKLAQASLADYGAQYTIDYDNFTLINVTRNGKNELVRVSPLEYSNIFVSMSKKDEGSVGYIEVNVVTKETKLVKVEGGMKYMPSAIFGKDLNRHIRFKYPTVMYSEINFEIDDAGKPYWVIPTEKKEIGVINGATSTGVIVVDPVSGEINKYDRGSEPSWIDRTISEEVVDKQATNAFRYKNGFMNVHFGSKKEVFQLSDGYNYFIKGGNTYYVSCITSPNEGDQTSIGFVTINLKTRVATKYLVAGITEMRAREIAMNDARVKAQTLEATWPILINYQGVETYFVVLKNDVQEQKMVFINVANGSLIAMGNTIEEARSEYDRLLADSGKTESKDIVLNNQKITNIRDLGSTIEFMVEGITDKYFVVSPSVSLDARFMKVGDAVSITCKDYGSYYYVISLTKEEKSN